MGIFDCGRCEVVGGSRNRPYRWAVLIFGWGVYQVAGCIGNGPVGRVLVAFVVTFGCGMCGVVGGSRNRPYRWVVLIFG